MSTSKKREDYPDADSFDEALREEAEQQVRDFEDAQIGKMEGSGVRLQDFRAYMPEHKYIYAPARALWPGASVDARVPPVPLSDRKGQPVLNKKGEQVRIPATQWLDEKRPVEQMTWAPGYPTIIKDRLIDDGGWIERRGVSIFNLYRPPSLKSGDASKAGPWIDHLRYVYPEDADHIIRWLAQRTQDPKTKINHILMLGGSPGIGKDTILEPVKHAIGPWNMHEVSPQDLLGTFNPHLKSVILRVSEVRDLGDFDRFTFYDHVKTYAAAPPDVLRVNEKNIRQYQVLNVMGVVYTTNHKTDGLYLPADDRRHYVAWSERTKDGPRFQDGYWQRLWDWYEKEGGYGHVAALLRTLDLNAFDPKAPPPKTPAFWQIVDANQSPEESGLRDAIERLGSPTAFTLDALKDVADGDTRSTSCSRTPRTGESCHTGSRRSATCVFATMLRRTANGSSRAGGRISTPVRSCH